MEFAAYIDGVDLSRSFRLSSTFSYRREDFGGILYHFEGEKPDPRVTFVDSPFLIDLLDLVGQAPLSTLLEEIQSQFELKPAEMETVFRFFSDLVKRGALVVE